MKLNISNKTVVLLFVFSGFLFFSCQSIKRDGINPKKSDKVANNSNRPNILWLVTEDMGPYIPPFGDMTVATPNLSRLAKEGVIYTNLYSTSGVCSPSRAAIATGMYPTSIGANHMRVNSNMDKTGLPAYEAIPPSDVRMISELLRSQGYYCTNNLKEDYQFKAPVTAWDESSNYAHWRNRGKDQPFYAVFNFTVTHESGLFEPYGFKNVETRHYHSGDTTYTWKSGNMTEKETSIHLPKDTKFKIPPYLQDTELVRRDMWKKYNNIAEMDKQLGAILKQLEEDGLLENTIIFFYGDHGGPMPRQKRLIYDSGLKTPMIIRFPNKANAGKKDDKLLSFIDFAPTLLSLIGQEPKDYLQGQAFLGNYQSKKERKYIHAAADRFDESTDAIRAVRDDRFKYIRNYFPEKGYYLPVAYREQIPTMKELLKLNAEGKLNEMQQQWFRTSKPAEELFDCQADPHELNNLAQNPKYAAKLNELRGEMDRWLKEIKDNPKLPERELISKIWSGSKSQPVTATPIITYKNGKAVINCETPGASIGYKIKNKNGSWPKSWKVYENPILLQQETQLAVVAHRMGFKSSKPIEVNSFK